ncbi:hypothetical protein GCM10010361_35440 [Streptomyces olivaceiscleroticus]|uniref:Uncharacterized protein n=1 Tax=Streptomyces olivaceiscleroticus TaxID=68245 RepID=A0ABN1A5N7_9ACTN
MGVLVGVFSLTHSDIHTLWISFGVRTAVPGGREAAARAPEPETRSGAVVQRPGVTRPVS